MVCDMIACCKHLLHDACPQCEFILAINARVLFKPPTGRIKRDFGCKCLRLSHDILGLLSDGNFGLWGGTQGVGLVLLMTANSAGLEGGCKSMTMHQTH